MLLVCQDRLRAQGKEHTQRKSYRSDKINKKMTRIEIKLREINEWLQKKKGLYTFGTVK
jgi:hypothetical protein